MSLYRSRWMLSVMALALLPMGMAQAQDTVKIEQHVPYLDSPNNIRMSNGTVELILATDYGPRIMRYAPASSSNDANFFGTIPGVTLTTTLGDWRIRGGHRLWHAPENNPGSYVPDNSPITAQIEGNTVKLIQPVEQPTGIQKEIWVTLDPTSSHVTVEHRLTNNSQSAVDMACWAMSAMNKGGMAIFPQEPYQSHDVALLPARPVVLWYYTDMADPRWKFGKNFITLRQDPKKKEPQKIGILNKQGWAAYARNGMLFLKRFAFEEGKTYPDYDCNNETFTNDVFLELETLGPMQHVEPGQTITYTENWWLFRNVNLGSGEAGIAAAMQPILAQTSGSK